MNYEYLKKEFIKLKKEELIYIDNISKISSNKILPEYEKLEFYRGLNNYITKLDDLIDKLGKAATEDDTLKGNFENLFIEFDLDKNYLSSLKYNRDYVLACLGINIDTLKFKISLYNLAENHRNIDLHLILNNQELIEKPIYVLKCYYDSTEDGMPFLGPIFGVYKNIDNEYEVTIPEKVIKDFEDNNIIIHSTEHLSFLCVKNIFIKELLNKKNKTLNDCIIKTQKRVNELNYINSPEYKEKLLLDKINNLYKAVEGKFIKKELLYSGNFLSVLRETYKLPNKKIVKKEKVIKNDGKNSVIVIAITKDRKYIITFQNRIKDTTIAEFPAGYIENNEEPIEAAKRELLEETGYITDDLFIVDEAYTSPGIDNSITYIVIANNCTKTNKKSSNGTELVNYGLFTEFELNYLIIKNIMNGAMNKLAYYNLINNTINFNTTYMNTNKAICKKLKEKINPIEYL